MKVMCEVPPLRSIRLVVTEHGIPYQTRVSGGRSHHSSRRSHDLKGGTGKTSRRAKGDRGTART